MGIVPHLVTVVTVQFPVTRGLVGIVRSQDILVIVQHLGIQGTRDFLDTRDIVALREIKVFKEIPARVQVDIRDILALADTVAIRLRLDIVDTLAFQATAR